MLSIRLAHAQIIILEFTPTRKRGGKKKRALFHFLKRNAPKLMGSFGLSGSARATKLALAL